VRACGPIPNTAEHFAHRPNIADRFPHSAPLSSLCFQSSPQGRPEVRDSVLCTCRVPDSPESPLLFWLGATSEAGLHGHGRYRSDQRQDKKLSSGTACRQPRRSALPDSSCRLAFCSPRVRRCLLTFAWEESRHCDKGRRWSQPSWAIVGVGLMERRATGHLLVLTRCCETPACPASEL